MCHRMVLIVGCWPYRMPFDTNGWVSTLVNVDWIKWMYFCVNELEVGGNDSIFSDNAEQKVYITWLITLSLLYWKWQTLFDKPCKKFSDDKKIIFRYVLQKINKNKQLTKKLNIFKVSFKQKLDWILTKKCIGTNKLINLSPAKSQTKRTLNVIKEVTKTIVIF